jgi:hypothetical protein
MSEEKFYQLGTHTEEQWDELHAELIADGNAYEAVPSRSVRIEDDKLHSPTRGTYLLTKEEADELKKDPRVKFINIDYSRYDEFKPPQDELQSVRPPLIQRYSGTVKNYREFETSNTLPNPTDSTDANRTGYQLYRCQQLLDPWVDGALADNAVPEVNIFQYGSGKDIDVIVADEGCWIGHPEFQNNVVLSSDGTTPIENPTGYVGGNKLPGGGTCDVLDVVLDGPYYIDPEWFNASTDPEYNNGAIIDVVGDGSDFFKREVTVNGVRIVAAGAVGGQTAVPDAFVEKVARMFELFTDPNGAGINEASQRTFIKTLSGDAGTYHAAVGPTLQRVARGAGADYTPNFLTDAGIASYNLSPLFDSHVANDMVWYLNSTGDPPGDGDNDAQEVIEHVFHTLHMHGLDAVSLKMYSYISADWNTGPLYNAMVEAYDGGFWDSSGYGGDAWKTDGDAFEVAAKEYLYLLNFCMFEYTSLWAGGSLSPEWSDSMRTAAGIQSNNPLGYALHNTYIAPVISKPSLATIRSIFQDGDTGDPTVAGASGYNVTLTDRLTTRWDGTRVPTEAAARLWWSNSAQRSSKFADAGTVTVSSDYTRANTQGDNSSQPAPFFEGQHGTPCGALTYGRTQGWAYNANKWMIDLYGSYGAGIEQGFDIQKLFHQLKPVNPAYGAKDPTISSNSWGYRSDKAPSATNANVSNATTLYYTHRATANVSYVTETGIAWLSHMGTQGDNGRWKSEMKTNSLTTALDELIDSGVIFVVAAGNSNQKCVNYGHPDFDNYITTTNGGSLEGSSLFEFGVEVTGTTNRRGFPQQGGKYSNADGSIAYKTINIGALDDDFNGGLESKVSYSDRGNGMDVYAPADGTLAANKNYTNEGPRPDTYDGLSYNGGTAYDCAFGGTSAACPVAAGFLATVMEHNRDWTWSELKAWIETLAQQAPSDFYYGVESTTPNDANWTDYESIEGGIPRVLYQGIFDARFKRGTRKIISGLTARRGVNIRVRKY